MQNDITLRSPGDNETLVGAKFLVGGGWAGGRETDYYSWGEVWWQKSSCKVGALSESHAQNTSSSSSLASSMCAMSSPSVH